MFSSPHQAGNRKPFAAMYKDVGVTSIIDGASPHKLVSLLYQQLGIEITRARGALSRRDVVEKCNAINKAVRIIEEGLNAPLDMEAGGSLSTKLRDLYDYMVKRLTLANLHGDDAALAECGRLTDTLRDGWDGIADPSHSHAAVAA